MYVKESEGSQASERSQVDYDQVSKDIMLNRTCANVFDDPDMQQFIAGFDAEALKEELMRVLKAFCYRNPQIGYCQGMNFVALLLVTVMNEEQAFWTFCTAVEDLRLRDYYSPMPAPLNGFQTDHAVLAALVVHVFPRVVQAIGADQLSGAVALVAADWLLSMFITRATFRTVLVVLDGFFHHYNPNGRVGADFALFRAALVVFGECERQLTTTDDLLGLVRSAVSKVTPATMAYGMLQKRFEFSYDFIESLRAQARNQIAQRFNVGGATFTQLARHTRFNKDQLRQLQQAFRAVAAEDQHGITREQFMQLLASAQTDQKSQFGTSAVKLSKNAVDRMFSMFDKDNSGLVDFKELASCLAVLIHGSMQERLRLCFDLYDSDGSGFLELDEVKHLAAAFFLMSGEEKTLASVPSDAKGDVIRQDSKFQARQLDARSPPLQQLSSPLVAQQLKPLNDATFGSSSPRQRPQLAPQSSLGTLELFYQKLLVMDVNKDGKITFDEFLSGMCTEPALLRCFITDGASLSRPASSSAPPPSALAKSPISSPNSHRNSSPLVPVSPVLDASPAPSDAAAHDSNHPLSNGDALPPSSSSSTVFADPVQSSSSSSSTVPSSQKPNEVSPLLAASSRLPTYT